MMQYHLFNALHSIGVSHAVQVLSNDDELLPRNERRRNLFARTIPDGKGKTTTCFVRCNLSLSLCNNFPRSVEWAVTSPSAVLAVVAHPRRIPA